MQCSEIIPLLSAYHDGELPADRAADVAAHVAQCPSCSAELRLFSKLSQMATRLVDQPPPPEVWQSIEANLDTTNSLNASPSHRRSLHPSRRTMLAASVLLFIGISSGLSFLFRAHDNHLVAVNLGPFIDLFERSPDEAQKQIIANYMGRNVSLAEADKELKYRPVAAAGLPADYELSEVSMLQMPCCSCLEVCYLRKSGGAICIFEYGQDQIVWFGNRNVSSTVCDGNPTRVVQMDGQIAATWQRNGRNITIVGAKDTDELSRIMNHFDHPGKPSNI